MLMCVFVCVRVCVCVCVCLCVCVCAEQYIDMKHWYICFINALYHSVIKTIRNMLNQITHILSWLPKNLCYHDNFKDYKQIQTQTQYIHHNIKANEVFSHVLMFPNGLNKGIHYCS